MAFCRNRLFYFPSVVPFRVLLVLFRVLCVLFLASFRVLCALSPSFSPVLSVLFPILFSAFRSLLYGYPGSEYGDGIVNYNR